MLHPAPLGKFEAGEIEILTRPHVLNGEFLRWAKAKQRTDPYIGILYQDDYVAVVRDAVRFPDASVGDYLRIVPKPLKSLRDGVVVVPIDGSHVCLRRMFRHAVREWQLEVPRGGIEGRETGKEACIRELRQETGLTARRVRAVGSLFPDTGLIASSLDVFVADVRQSEGKPAQPERTEAMGRMVWIDYAGYLRKLRKGAIRDALTISALNLARARGVWKE